jgi:hypothetical protein
MNFKKGEPRMVRLFHFTILEEKLASFIFQVLIVQSAHCETRLVKTLNVNFQLVKLTCFYTYKAERGTNRLIKHCSFNSKLVAIFTEPLH